MCCFFHISISGMLTQLRSVVGVCCYQERAACSLSLLVQFCVTRETSPNAKIIKNLCSMLCSDPRYTPVVNQDAGDQLTKPGPGKLCSLGMLCLYHVLVMCALLYLRNGFINQKFMDNKHQIDCSLFLVHSFGRKPQSAK